MEKEIVVSVICFAYNHEKYIRKTLDSILMQKTDFAFEIIVHDDCSTDSTALIIKEYLKNFPNIIKPIFQKENTFSKYGFIDYFSVVEQAQGKYVANCECDDFWTDENKLQIQYDFMEKNLEYSVCGHAHYNIYEDGVTLKSISRYSDHDTDAETDGCCEGNPPFHTATVFFRNTDLSLLNKVCVSAAIDIFLLLYLHTLGKARYINRVMSVYRTEAISSLMKNHIYGNNRMLIDFCTKCKASYSRFNYYIADLCYKGVQRMDYKIAHALGDLEALKSDYLLERYNSISPIEKFAIYCKNYFPFLRVLYRILFKRVYQEIIQRKFRKQYERDKLRTKESGLRF